MKNHLTKSMLIGISLLVATPAFAEWGVEERPEFVGGGYTVRDKETGRQLDTAFKTKKGARAAAKLLNKADKLADKNDG